MQGDREIIDAVAELHSNCVYGDGDIFGQMATNRDSRGWAHLRCWSMAQARQVLAEDQQIRQVGQRPPTLQPPKPLRTPTSAPAQHHFGTERDFTAFVRLNPNQHVTVTFRPNARRGQHYEWWTA